MQEIVLQEKKETWQRCPAVRTDIRDEMFWRACCYYPGGCYCTKPKTGNEMMYGLLLSRQGVCVYLHVCEWTCLCLCVLNEEPGGTICLTAATKDDEIVSEKRSACVCSAHPPPPRSTFNKHAHLYENTHTSSLSPLPL